MFVKTDTPKFVAEKSKNQNTLHMEPDINLKLSTLQPDSQCLKAAEEKQPSRQTAQCTRLMQIRTDTLRLAHTCTHHHFPHVCKFCCY
jgi:hypothetical protein